MRAAIALAVLALLVGCAAPRYMVNQATRPEISPKPAQAELVVIRDGHLCFFITVDEFLDGRMIGQTRGRSYFTSDVAPGTHYITASGMDTDTVRVAFEPGRVYFLELHMYPGGFVSLSPMATDKALSALGSLTYRTYNGTGADLPAEEYRSLVDKFERESQAKPEKFKYLTDYEGAAGPFK